MSKAEKIKIEFPRTRRKTLVWKDHKIHIDQYLSMDDKVVLIGSYIQTLFGFDDALENRLIIAEYGLIMRILDTHTNIDIDELDISRVVNSGLWDEIKKRIFGFDHFKDVELAYAVSIYNEEKRIESSVGVLLDRIGARIIEILDNLPDLNSDELYDTLNNFSDGLKKLESNVPGILEEKNP